MSNKSNLGNRLALTTALAGILFAGYGGRSVYAGTCVGAVGAYTCSGTANSGTDITQNLAYAGAPALSVTTTAGFGIDTSVSGGMAVYLDKISGIGDLLFTDTNAAAITGDNIGIHARNRGGGAISITTTGVVTGTGANSTGIYASNNGTNLLIDARADVSGGSVGIGAYNYGNGEISVITTGVVTGTNLDGISVYNSYFYTTDMLIDTQADVSGGFTGIFVRNYGAGTTTIITAGVVTGTNRDGIFGRNSPISTNLLIDAQADVSGRSTGIDVINAGVGMTSITTAGVVTGTDFSGIYARNLSTSTNLLISAQADVSGYRDGVEAHNKGSGETSITTAGAVTGTRYSGIYAIQ
ncbi:MAG: hypothetical protein L3J24_14130 [Xanthomonadales bacterium]|nr:hypothetical protein [Xanthomonadales bacterium]